jgi:BirA family transcriptional regulator, biotin operon repressor / biotin---[acetyl-CoA-carboxylase] ligase
MKIIHKHFESLTSTNDWAKEHLSAMPKESLLLITADEQTAARGQYGRGWVSPKGENLYATFGFFLEVETSPLCFTHLLAISAARTLEEHGIVCRLKWPNDLLVGQKKIAGILCETSLFPQAVGIVIGIGLNINMTSDGLKAIDQPATSLLSETNQHFDIPHILHSLKNQFASDLTLFLQKGFTPFLSSFQSLIKK